MKIFQPLFLEEVEKKNFYQNILFKSKKNFFEKNLENFSKDLSKKTRILEISEIFRFNFLKNINKIGEKFLCYQKILKRKENSVYFLSYIEILFFKEAFFKILGKDDIFLYFFYIDYTIFKKFFHQCRYLIKKFEEKEKKTKPFIKLTLYKTEYFFTQKNYKASKNCINFLQNLTEKEEFDKKTQIEIFLKAGILSVKENKIVLAFSYFFEALEKISNFSESKNNFIFEWLLFCSNFIKKKKINIFCKKNRYKYNISNFIFLEFLITGFRKEIFVLLEASIREKIWPFGTATMKFFLSKNFNFVLKNRIKQFFETFIRIPLTELSIVIGISKRKIYLILSKLILEGETKGLLDFQTDSFVNFEKFNSYFIFSDFLNILIQLDQIVLNILEK
ncbi:hypothetical protein HAN_1g98 (nucleomorph) [Hemiselmis andersenii]|uniref:Uncharacterized protein n=1 Tax=Hemiselmis andersenii TaxID=464988 RepID=A9BKA7_HEMAN|nr:hypothetical protein HAN_1g98 [Hemiselmis andersenii]ABW97940.1 hypothetical protein HAN_1g98 [Hemiselmis andersenii]